MAVAQRSTPPMSNVTISPCARVLDVSSVWPFHSQKTCTSSNGISIWTMLSTTLSSLTVHCDDGCVAASLRDANGNSVRLLWRQVSLITSGRWKNCSCSTVSLFPNKRDTTVFPYPLNRYEFFQRLFLHLSIGLEIYVGRFDICVTEPEGDDGYINPSLEQRHGRRIPPDMGRDV